MTYSITQLIYFLQIACCENNLNFSDQIIRQLSHYIQLLYAWNRIFNLTAITDIQEVIYLHIIDSLTVTSHIHGTKLLDVGSGAGLPGIPLAITNPDLHISLLDKNIKKIRFLIQARAELNLINLKVIHARCEQFMSTDLFDTIMTRAFGSLNHFVTTTQHLLKADGKLLALKGKYPHNELLELAKSFNSTTTQVSIHGRNVNNPTRHIVTIRK